MSWNPNSSDNCAVGLEWAPLRQADRPVTGVASSSYSWLMESSVTEDIDRLYTYSAVEVPSAYDVIDIYEVGDLAPVRPVVASYPYTSDASFGFVRPTGGRFYAADSRTESVIQARMDLPSPGIKWHTLIDDNPLVAGTYRGRNNFITSTFDDAVPIVNRQFIGLTAFPSLLDPIGGDYASSFSQWTFHANSLNTGTTGKRILGLTVKCLCQRLVDPRARSSEFDQPYRIRPAIIVGGVNTFGQAQLMPSTPGEVSFTWPQNPVTGRAWTPTELAAFSGSVATSGIAWLMSRPDDPAVRQATAGAIYRATAEVTFADETRVAQAIRTQARQNVGWNEWQVTAIGGGDWGKVATEDYLLNDRLNAQQAVDWRPALSTTGLSVRALGDATGTTNGVYEVEPVYVGQIPRSVGVETGFTPAVVLRNPVGDGGALSTDGNPYSVIYDDREVQVIRPDGQDTVAQLVLLDFDDGAVDSVKLWVRSENGQRPTGQIVVKVLDSASVLLETSEPFTGDELVSPTVWQQVTLEFVSPSWPSGADNYVITVEASGGTVGWQVLSLTDGTLEPGATTLDIVPGNVTFGGTGYSANGGDPFAVRADADVSIVLGRTPQIPSGLDAQPDSDDPLGPSVTIEWDGNPTDDCSSFGRYELQRAAQTTTGTVYDFQTVFITDVDGTETVYEFTDYEAPRNADVSYRIRMVSDIGFASDYSGTQTVTLQDDRCGYWFRTNLAPHLNVWLDDIGQRDFTFPERTTFFEFEGRDGVEQVRGLTDLLDRFRLTVLIAGKGATAPTFVTGSNGLLGRAIFDVVLVLAGNKRAQDGTLYRLPWVTVCDQDGRNWFAALVTPQASRVEPAGQYTAIVEVTELTRTPPPVTLVDVGSGVLEPVDRYPDGAGS